LRPREILALRRIPAKRRSYVAGSVRERLAALSVSASVGTASSFAVRDVTRPQREALRPPRGGRSGRRIGAFCGSLRAQFAPVAAHIILCVEGSAPWSFAPEPYLRGHVFVGCAIGEAGRA